MSGFVFVLVAIIVVYGIPLGILRLMGFRFTRGHRSHQPTRATAEPPVRVPSPWLTADERREVLLAALAQPPFVDRLFPEQRDSLRHALLATGSPAPQPAAAAPAQSQVFSSATQEPEPEIRRKTGQAMVETVRASWDPAVLMLYLGALLVVIAGLIFASYSWGTWGGWQKLGMLVLATAAFLGAGFGLQRYERIRPAAHTFISIGGLLVPANALAAYTIFSNADPLLILFSGASVTAIIHGILATQPQSRVFRFTAVAAFILGVTSLPGAIGLRAVWGGALALTLIALAPDPWGRLVPYARAWMVIGTASILALTGIGIIGNEGDKHWVLPVILMLLSMSLNRVGQRAPHLRLGLNVAADVVLVAANVTAAWILTGDQWLISTVLLSTGLILLRSSRTYPELAMGLEPMAVFPLAGFLGNATFQLSTAETGTTVFFGTLTVGMVLLARRWPSAAALLHGIAVFTLPATLVPLLDPIWNMAVFSTVLTLTLILWRWRWQNLGDVPYALASLTAIAAVFFWGNVFEIESNVVWTWIITGVAVAATMCANLLRSGLLVNWVRHLLRLEGLALFWLAFELETKYAGVLLTALMAMGWNVWASQHAVWSLPGAVVLGELVTRFVVLEDVSTYWTYLWESLPVLLMAALAWQLDRRTARWERPAGLYVWIVAIGTAVRLALEWDVQGVAHLVGIPIGLITLAAIHVLAMRSTAMPIFLLPAAIYLINANALLLQPAVRDSDHRTIAGGFLAATAVMLWRTTLMRSRIAFALLALVVLHLNAAYDQPAVPGVLIGLVAAWFLIGLGMVHARTGVRHSHLGEAALEAGLMHVVAIIGPQFGTAREVITRPAVVLVLVSLAGVIATYGMIVRSRWQLFVASVVAMAALMLQINAGEPGNVHAYTVPLAVYLLAVGLLLRHYPRTANGLLAAGSGVLVVPAMLEALTTGSLNWLWIALAESLALFLLGTVLQLRIPTAAAVIAVSVIALRMLVMAINAYASWVSILAIGVALLLLGTLWLMYRDAIQDRLHGIFSRWLAFH